MEEIVFANLSQSLMKKAYEILDFLDPKRTGSKVISSEQIKKYIQNYDSFIKKETLGERNEEDIFISVFTKKMSETIEGGLSLFVKIHKDNKTTCIVSTKKGNTSEVDPQLEEGGSELLKKFLHDKLFMMVLEDTVKPTNELIEEYNKKKGGKRNHQKRRSTKKKRKSTKKRSSHQ